MAWAGQLPRPSLLETRAGGLTAFGKRYCRPSLDKVIGGFGPSGDQNRHIGAVMNFGRFTSPAAKGLIRRARVDMYQNSGSSTLGTAFIALQRTGLSSPVDVFAFRKPAVWLHYDSGTALGRYLVFLHATVLLIPFESKGAWIHEVWNHRKEKAMMKNPLLKAFVVRKVPFQVAI
jgi:hypothetical protein